MAQPKKTQKQAAEDAAEKKSKRYTPEIEEQLRGKTPLEQQRILAMANMKSRWGRDDAIITAAHLDDGLTFIDVDDLMYQWALQRPGYAVGKIQSLIGFEGASKTSKQLWLANQCLRQGGQAAGVFVEHADSTTHMKNYIEERFMDYFPCYVAETLEEAIAMTYDIQKDWEFQDEFFIKRRKELKEQLKALAPKVKKLKEAATPENPLVAEQMMLEVELNNIIEAIKNIKRVQIFDSIAGATQEKLLKDDSEPGAPKPGGIGGIMADFVNAMKTRIRRTRSLWAVNNQAREDIPIGFAASLPRPEIEKLVAKGGKAVPFHASYFEVIKKGGSLKDDEKQVEGFEGTLTFKKNKYGVPLRKISYDVVWGVGIVFRPHTMATFAAGHLCGLHVSTVKGVGKVYYSKELGIPSTSALPEQEMYDLIHSPQFKPKFQEALGIVTDVTSATPTSDSEDLAEEPEEVVQVRTGPPPPPPGGTPA